MNDDKRQVTTPKDDAQKANPTSCFHPEDSRGQTGKLSATVPAATGRIEDGLAKLRAAGATAQKIRLSLQRELELAKQIRAEAERYQQESETKVRSQVQHLILSTRLATQKEIEKLIRQASTEIQKVLADIRMIRITAQEELETQRKYTSAARIRALSLASLEEAEELEVKNKEAISV